MNKKRKQRFIGLFLAMVICSAFVLAEVNLEAATPVTITNSQIGTHDGYDFELWKDYGTTSMTLTDGGTFSCSWSNIGNALFRKGKKFNPNKPHEEIGEIELDFNVNYAPNGNSYLCVYGWTVDPLVEYYIVESWGSWRPSAGTLKGNVSIDGGIYDVYQSTRTQQPSIQGTKTFEQYWFVRRTKRTSGTVSVSEFFRKWESLGMNLGKLYETALTVEGYQSSGTATVLQNDLRIGTGGGPTPTTPPTTAPSGENARIYCNTMDITGQYADVINSPFAGVALYASDESVSKTLNFTKGTHNISLRGCSNNNLTATVALYIGGVYKNTFNLSGSSPQVYTINNVSHGTGNQLVELRCTGDIGTWDAFLDYIEFR